MSSRLPPQDPAPPQEPVNLRDPEPGRSPRRADRPTAPAAARASLRATARALELLATEPRRRRAQRQARIALGQAVADHLAGQPAPQFLATPLAAHRAAQLRLASTDPPPRPDPSSRSDEAPSRAAGGSRASRSRAARTRTGRAAARDRDVAAELERLLLIVVQFLPRLAAQARLRATTERLGAWATGLTGAQAPAVAAALERAAPAQRAVTSARAEAAAQRRQAAAAARLALKLAADAVADVVTWIGRGIAIGSSMLVAWLVSLTVAGRRRLRHGSATTRQSLRAGSVAAGRGVRAGSAAAGRHVRAGSVAAGRRVRGAGTGLADAAGGLASRIDAAVARGRNGANGDRSTPAPTSATTTTEMDRAATGHPGQTIWLDGPDTGDPEQTGFLDGPGTGDPTGTPAGAGHGDPAGASAGAGNGSSGGTGRGRLVPDPADPIEAWWLPSDLAQPAPSEPAPSEPAPWEPAQWEQAEAAPATGRRARRHRRPGAARDPVVAGLAGAFATMARPFRAAGARLAPVVTALAAPPNRRRSGWLPFARPVAVALALALLVGTATAVPAAILVADSVKGAGAGLPELEELRQLRQPERTQVYDREGRVIEVLKDEQDRIVIPLSRMSPLLQQAVIAAEDARFYEHRGVDDRGILRAAVTNLLSGQVDQGGSTITQQLVRNAYPDLKDISLVRKIKEAALAAQLEGKLSKQEILHRYLNRVYFGAGYYGVEAASRGYFGRTAAEVTLSQSAMLAGVIREPVTGDPRKHPDRAKTLRDSVLDRMVQLGMLAPADAAEAKKERLAIKQPRRVGGRYPWFIDGLRRQLLDDERLGKTREGRLVRLFEGGLRIHTTLDRDMQRAAEEAVARWRPPNGPDIALIAIDPRDGGVRAVVGGRNFKDEAYNSAVQGVGRQPGSSFKTFVLAAALEAGISPDSVWESSGFRDQLVCGSNWSVDNYEGGGSGLVPVRAATWHSVNGVYARLMAKLCPERVAAMAEKLGIPKIPPDKRVPSMALGSAEVRPIDMASAYATLANLGEYHKPTFFERVDHRSGKSVIGQPSPPERRISAALAWQVTDILKGVVTGGTGVAANIGRPVAGKTGTNQEYRDAWFVGYTPQLAVAVWMGDPKSLQPMYNVQGQRVTGGSFPARVWHDFMAVAMADQEVLDWPKPAEELSYTILPPPPKPEDDKKDKNRRHERRRKPNDRPGRNN